jgi:hypothetical protein
MIPRFRWIKTPDDDEMMPLVRCLLLLRAVLDVVPREMDEKFCGSHVAESGKGCLLQSVFEFEAQVHYKQPKAVAFGQSGARCSQCVQARLVSGQAVCPVSIGAHCSGEVPGEVQGEVDGAQGVERRSADLVQEHAQSPSSGHAEVEVGAKTEPQI